MPVRVRQWAPAWFYSALNWLGKSYLDASGVGQAFGSYMFGSDVDPYVELGSTCLFVITRTEDVFSLNVAADAASSASLADGTRYPVTDLGILAMYQALAASPAFAAAKFCYIPTRLSSVAATALAAAPERLPGGYDPSTGIRVMAQGSAVAQAVPVADFLLTHNEQVYDPSPTIVPVVTALVFDITKNNAIGATSFALPVFYARDQIAGAAYVNRIATTVTVDGAPVQCGQTALFTGGAGYDDTRAVTLKEREKSVRGAGGLGLSTYGFEGATAVVNIPIQPRVQIGVCTLTYAGLSPQQIFARQSLAGFYRPTDWTTCLGLPIYDYGASNSAFTSAAQALTTPTPIYGGAQAFLNGGTLQVVLQKLLKASYMLSSASLVSILDEAIATPNTNDAVGGALDVTTAALEFHMQSPASAAVVNQLNVPVLATVTTTPARIVIPIQERPVPIQRPGAVAPTRRPIEGTVSTVGPLQPIGGGRNAPSATQLSPTTIQVPLTAVVPQSVLAATGLGFVPIGTDFPQQAMGEGATFQGQAAGVVLNLTATPSPTLAPFSLELESTGFAFVAGATYTLTLVGEQLTISGSGGAAATVTLPSGGAAGTTFVGMMVYVSGSASTPLYPLTPQTLPAPGVGQNNVVQGVTYGVRLTWGKKTSTYDIFDSTQTLIAGGVSVATPTSATKGAAPKVGDLLFGTFVGGATTLTVWSIPVFLPVRPSDLAGAGFNGAMTLAAQVTGLPGYELSITDSSLFVYSNINVDTGAVGSISPANVYLASAVINTAPDATSPTAFAPSKLVMGIIRQVQMGGVLVYVFIPEDDSVVIGEVRYMLSVINLGDMVEDPNALPYPPSYWPKYRFWQFANRHNPYLAVEYSGATEGARVAVAAKTAERIAGATRQAREPMQLYLDTNSKEMKLWPIYAFPYSTSSQAVDQGQLKFITTTILQVLGATFPPAAASASIGEQIILPAALAQNNPYTLGVATADNPAGSSPLTIQTTQPSTTIGQTVTNLSPNTLSQPSTMLGADDIAIAKSLAPALVASQERTAASEARGPQGGAKLQPIYGFSVYNPLTHEAYLVEVVGTDLTVPDQIPDATQNTTYDPYYVRVVFLNTLTCYNMSIIAPAMARDQYGYLAQEQVTYQNLLAKTQDPTLGYLYQIDDAGSDLDQLYFIGGVGEAATDGKSYLYTNIPYRLRGGSRLLADQAVFVCRRRNWDATCHLMQSTRLAGTSVYLAFGGGDLAPMRLDAGVAIDKTQPAHMHEFSYAISDKHYDSAQAFSVGNTPYFVGVTTAGGVVQYTGFSISASSGTAGVTVGDTATLTFPPDIYVVGQASTTLATIPGGTGTLANQDETGAVIGQSFQLLAYNNLVYLVRAVSNVAALAGIGGSASGLLIDTYVATPSGQLALAQGARYKQSGLQYFGSTYTPTTMVDTLDQLDFTSITGETFYASTIFIPIKELDSSVGPTGSPRGFIVNLSDFLGQQIWTIIYPEVVAQAGETVNGVAYADGYNLDADGKPVLSLQKLHFVYDPLAVLFTPNDLTHKYPLQPKQQVLALTNGQIREAISWRTANPLPGREPPSNVCAQQTLPTGWGMDRTNIIYASNNRPVWTPLTQDYKGMSVNGFVSLSGTVYNIEESAMTNDQTGSGFISQVSSTSNMLVSVLFDYDNDELGTLKPYSEAASNKGVVFINGYLSATGYSFSSPDHFDVEDVLPSQVPLLDEIADILGDDVAFYNIDASLPRQYWSFAYDTLTGPGLPNFIADAPPAPVDPTFSNRTRSLLLNLQNPVRPTQLGVVDTHASVVSANLVLESGVTGAIFLGKKADRDIASIGTPATATGSPPADTYPLYGLSTKYDFYIFSRDHYATLAGCQFELIDQGYAMCLTDDGTGTGTKNAQYFINNDGSYNELFAYVLYSPTGGVLETASFILKVTLSNPVNSVNPVDMVAQINKASSLIYAASGPMSQGQPAAYLAIQAVGGEVQAQPILGAPGFAGYALNVSSASRQPVQISQIYSGSRAYSIAGSTTNLPQVSGAVVAFYGSISHGLDKQVRLTTPLQSADLTAFIPRPTIPPAPAMGTFGGNGQGAMIGMPFSGAFQGSGAIPPAIAAGPPPGTTMKADDTVFYTFNAVTNTAMDSAGRPATADGSQYFVDDTDPANPIWGVIAPPQFSLWGNTYTINVNTTLADGATSRYTLVVGNRSFLFANANQVTVDRTRFTFGPLTDGIYPVTFAALDAPAVSEAPSPIPLTPFSVTAGGGAKIVDVFNDPGGLKDMPLGVMGRTYTYDPVHAVVTVTAGTATKKAPVQTGLAFVSATGFAYVIGFTETDGGTGAYTVNGQPMFPYAASTSGSPASSPIMTAPLMFTIGGSYYVFDQNASGAWVSVTGAGRTTPINPYQVSLDGAVYILNTNVQPNTVVGGGATYTMTAGNTQFIVDNVQYTIAPTGGSLNGATISGQFDIQQADVVVLENYAYQLDIPNGQIVGNGAAYPLTSSGFTYSITTANQSYTVTTEPNAVTVTIGGVVYQINNTSVVGDGVTYPILAYRTFKDGAATYQLGLDGTVNLPNALALSTATTPPTFADGATTYTVNASAAFDGAAYHLITGSPAEFQAAGLTWQVRTDGVSIAAGPAKTYIANTGAPLPNQFTFGTQTIHFGRPTDVAAFDGETYYAIAANAFTDASTGQTFTLSGNTAVHEGNSYEIYSNLGAGAYFEVPGGKTYFVNVAVADFGTPNGTIYKVFPTSGGGFTMPLQYTITITGAAVKIASSTFGAATAVPSLTAAGGVLTGGHFQDPVTQILYTCVVDAGVVTFIDSNNTIYPYPAAGSTDVLTVSVVVTTGVPLAVNNAAPPTIYPILNNQFSVGAAPTVTTYTVNVLVAYANAAAGPFWPMTNGRFIVPQAAPTSNTAYTVRGASVIKGFVISEDDEFSPDGNVVYAINAANVARASDQATLAGTTVSAGPLSYALNSPAGFASIRPAGLTYDHAAKTFTVNYGAGSVIYTVAGASVSDNRQPANTFTGTLSGIDLTVADTVSGVTFTFDTSGANPITASFPYSNAFFIDPIAGTTYYIDTADNRVEALSYLPETTRYAFTAANGQTYLIHYSDVEVVFPVISGAEVDAGVASVGEDIFAVEIDAVDQATTGAGILTNKNSFEINGNLYTITGAPKGADYSTCTVVGDAIGSKPFLTKNTFSLSDSTVIYTLQLDAANLPLTVTTSLPVKPSRDLISVNDNVYLITYGTVSAGSLLGQGQGNIPITNSGFKLTNPFDSTVAKFTFDDLNIYDAGAVVGQFTVYLAPTFFLGGSTYTFNPTTLVVTDNSKRPYPLIANPMMFSINGFNYVIDNNRAPHAIVGNGIASPLSTDITVQAGRPVANSTFTLNGLVYAYVEDAQHNLLTVLGTKLYPISQPGLTFKLDSSLVFTLLTKVPAAGNYAGTVVPIGTVAAGPVPITSATMMLNLYAGTSESGGADYFMYKNVMYTLIKSAGVYTAVQKSFTVYASSPAATQQQLAVFDLAGTTYMVTDGTTVGVAPPAGINPATMWSQTATAPTETQFGLVYGFAAQPTSVTFSTQNNDFEFIAPNSAGVATLYDILYTVGGGANMVQVNVPDQLPGFTQTAFFNFVTGAPLTVETGGYNAFTAVIAGTATPVETFAAAFKTPLVSTDSAVDTLMGLQGDFTLEFWHSLTLTPVNGYHPFTYTASTIDPLVYMVDVDFDDPQTIYLRINNTLMQTTVTPPVFSSRWRHFALSYIQPYTMICNGAGYEVKDGTNYDFSGDFSIAMTFSVTDVGTRQGLLYKGTGADNTSPQLAMSYRLTVNAGAVTLMIVDGDGNPSQEFIGPAIEPKNFYQVIVVKHATTAATGTGGAGSTDPYAPPFDTSELNKAPGQGGNATVTGLQSSNGALKMTNTGPNDDGSTPKLTAFLKNLSNETGGQSFTVVISVRQVNDDGTFSPWSSSKPFTQTVTDSTGLSVQETGSAHVLIGAAFSDSGAPWPLGGPSSTGNIRDLYLFNGAIDPTGIRSHGALVDIAAASAQDLARSGIVGYWHVAYDPNGVVNNPYDQTAVAVSTNASAAFLAPLSGHELEGAGLFIDGYQMPLSLAPASVAPTKLPPYATGGSLLAFNAGAYRLEEISIWNMARAQYQILDDMFGRLDPANEPFLSVYLSGEVSLPDQSAPALPMAKYLYAVKVPNAVTAFPFDFTSTTLDLIGSPCVGRCGPLITPNLYTPPGVALTVCDTPPSLTSYSVTLNTTTGSLAGEINEGWVYIKNNVLMLYAGKKIGDLTLTWVSQEQGDVQIVGYIEGAPPAPMANLSNKTSYIGATSVTLSAPTSITLKYQAGSSNTTDNKLTFGDNAGVTFGLGPHLAPLGFGLAFEHRVFSLALTLGDRVSYEWSDTNSSQNTPSLKLEESNRYTVKMQGTLSAYTGDTFMANLNAITIPGATPSAPGAKAAILPSPNLGGFTASNPAGQLPRTGLTDEKFGQRLFAPSPYGQAFVTSQTLDVYQQTLVQSGTVYGFIAVPNAQIPRDLNIVSFRLNSQYIRPGSLDGAIGYGYNPATLPSGAQTYATSTGQMQPLYDGNFAPGVVGHDASYMRVVEAYQIKKQIDQQAFNSLALYQSAYSGPGSPDSLPDPSLTPSLDFYDEYIWSSRGGLQEVKHTYTTSYEESLTTSSIHTTANNLNFNIKLSAAFVTALDFSFAWDYSSKDTWTYTATNSSTASFDIIASFDGIDTDTQMRYASNNDAHFVMNFNSMYNPNNQSGVELVIGSDGLVYQIVPSVASGAGLPTSNNLDTTWSYSQPQPSYTTGNADGLTGNLAPYDRPGKTSLFRTYAFFLQPSQNNAQTFWNTVVDPIWLANSGDPDAVALQSAQGSASLPWRLLWRVTYAEQFLPPISTGSTAIPQITPLMAVPVTSPASSFLFQAITSTAPRPAGNPANDLEANIVLVTPTASGVSAGATPASGPGAGSPVQPNNVIPFDLAATTASIVNWGDSNNAGLLGQLVTSALGTNLVTMSPSALPGSTLVAQIADPVNGGTLYSIYTDPNGLTVNVPRDIGISVYQDVNGNPIQYFDGKTYHSLQDDYLASPDGSIMYYVEPPSTYNQATFSLYGDYDLFTAPGDQWRYYLVSGMSSNMSSQASFAGEGVFLNSSGFDGFAIAAPETGKPAPKVAGYVVVQGVLQYPNLNTNAETFADVAVYKAMALLDVFPIGDPETLVAVLKGAYPQAPFIANDEINLVFARNITSYFNTLQQALIPQ